MLLYVLAKLSYVSMPKITLDRFRKEYDENIKNLDRYCIGTLEPLQCYKGRCIEMPYKSDAIVAIYVPLEVNKVRWALYNYKDGYEWNAKMDYCPDPSLREILLESKRLPGKKA